MKIFGAGIAGLLAGCVFQDAHIYEAKSKEDYTGHKALMRFRTTAISDMTCIPFKKVRVHKGIYYQGGFTPLTIGLANLYSKKVIGSLADRSIWNTESVDRWIAPRNLVEQLIEMCGNRIHWEHKVDIGYIFDAEEMKINTLPLSQMVKNYGGYDATYFGRKPVIVKRWSIPHTDVHQTIYYPDPLMALYRASIVGDILIAEYTDFEKEKNNDSIPQMLASFGITGSDIYPEEKSYSYDYGKIQDIDDEWRKKFLLLLTQKYNIFSLGRYGTWRNILADDLPHDINVIKRLMNESEYDNLTRRTGWEGITR